MSYDSINPLYETNNYYIPLTIEKHLKNYSECKEHIDRHEILWHEWNHNKRWLIQIQQLILPSFPSYSRHDVSHSETVLHNIELLLGEKNIRSLSATDCFILLHTVYIHDIGMCITHEDRNNIITNEKFHNFLKQLKQNANSDLAYYAQILLQEYFKDNTTDNYEKTKKLLKNKLDIFYAVTYLIAEFRRIEHGDISKERLLQWMKAPDKLGMGFSTIELPERLFHIIGSCAAAHTKWDFQEILNLPQEDTGFVIDYIHPRFIAVLLQLGDALDMDNDRFHPLMKEYLGKFPDTSEIHYKKHKSIRRLRIKNEKISISADCSSQDELRLIRTECDTIRSILKNATFYWSVIKPRESNMCLPTFDKSEVLLNGKAIPLKLIETQFEISQEKAFSLIKGNNIYKDKNFVFLRELLQNASDATKFQYFRDCKRKLKQLNEDIDILNNPINAKKIVSPKDYPIKVELSIKKQKNGKLLSITSDEMNNLAQISNDYICGVLVKIIDCGVGISETDIDLIANVGSSHSFREKEISEMPAWLQPTGTFGIGLHSVFLVGEFMKAITYTRNGEQYEITFYPRLNANEGYINVTPLDDETNVWNSKPYGTAFEVFVPYSKKKLHSESPRTWDGKDPFSDKYESTRQIRHSRELLKQMAFYLDEIIGESLFPITINIFDEETLENPNFINSFNNDILAFPTKNISSKSYNMPSRLTWVYSSKYNKNIHKDDDGNIYFLDTKFCKLYIWDQSYQTYARMGIERILKLRDIYNSIENQSNTNGIPIFYKGIWVTEKTFKEDSNLVEYIDIKMTLDQQYLKLSRSGFSSEGEKYLEKIYKNSLLIFRKALIYYGTQKNKKNTYKYTTKIERTLEKLIEEKNNPDSFKAAEKMILSIAGLVYFSLFDKKREKEPNDIRKENGWTILLSKVQSSITNEPFWKNSTLFHMNIWKFVNDDIAKDEKSISILDLINNKKKYAIISRRRNHDDVWRHFLLEIDDIHSQIKNNIKQLRSTMDISQRKNLIQQLEKIPGENLIKGTFFERNWSDSIKKKEEPILKWLIRNVPTMALYASTDGNTRVNILDMETCDSVFFNFNMKKLTLERINEYHDKYERFSLPVWTGYQNLCLDTPRNSIKFIKRGKISRVGYGIMLFPLSGEELKSFQQFCDTAVSQTESKINKLNNLLFKKLLNRIRETDIYMEGRYWSTVKIFFKPHPTFSQKNYSIHDITEDNINKIIEDLKNMSYDKPDSPWNTIVKPALMNLKHLLNEYDRCIDIQKWFEKNCKNQLAYSNMRNYVKENSKFSLNNTEINDLYYCFLTEIKDCILKSKKEAFFETLFDQKLNILY